MPGEADGLRKLMGSAPVGKTEMLGKMAALDIVDPEEERKKRRNSLLLGGGAGLAAGVGGTMLGQHLSQPGGGQIGDFITSLLQRMKKPQQLPAAGGPMGAGPDVSKLASYGREDSTVPKLKRLRPRTVTRERFKRNLRLPLLNEPEEKTAASPADFASRLAEIAKLGPNPHAPPTGGIRVRKP